MKTFIGRENELTVLEDAYKSCDSSFVVLYGRRRVGKSELILQFLKDKPNIYFVGQRAQAVFQTKEILSEAATVLNQPLLSKISTDNWKEVLNAIDNAWQSDKKLVIALDEFQWIVDASPELPSIIQAIWDRYWKKNGKFLLILCGSYIGFMEREVLGSKSPLFGRRTAQIKLEPFNYLQSGQFHPNYSLQDRAKTYFLCGGIPLYLNFFQDSQSVETNIIKNMLNPHMPLFQEPDFLLREELREVKNYHGILFSVASGDTSHSDISKKTGIDNRILSYYMKQLNELGYIKKKYPLSEKKASQRNVKYTISDPLLRFWFHYIHPNMSYIVGAGSAKAFSERIKPSIESFYGHCFESLCREALTHIYLKNGLNAAFTIGEYWDKSVQIDVVGLRDDNWIDIGECKWGSIKSIKKIQNEIMAKITGFPNKKNASIQCHLFTKADINKKLSSISGNITFHSLNDIYLT